MREWRVMSRWRAIPSCPGYEASDYGRIYSLRSKRLLSGSADRYGYYYVNVMVGGERAKRKIHRLVCEAFHGPCPEGHECGHLDGAASNNRADNLAWVTRSENNRHQVRHGTFRGTMNLTAGQPTGENNPCAKLTNTEAADIRARILAGETCRPLAREYGVNKDTISLIGRGIAYPEGQTPLLSRSNKPGRET